MTKAKGSKQKGKSTEVKVCFHCGDDCRDQHTRFNEKDFCCNGCKVVYEILNENELCTYYDLDKNPGLSLKSRDFGDKFNYLDNNEIADLLVDFSDEKRVLVTFHIPSIHCSSCIWLLENLQKIRPGINHTRVHFTKKEIRVEFDPGIISLRAVVELLATLGYEPHISLKEAGQNAESITNRDLYIKIGIAGFAFGNIMLLSFPEYFGFAGLGDHLIQRFISYLNVLLVLPVVFYCALDYYRSAFTGLRHGYFNIDVPIALGITVLFSRSLYEVFIIHAPGYLDSLAGLVFFLLVGRWFQNYTYQGLSFDRDYKSYFPLAVLKENGDQLTTVPVLSLKKGDRIFVRNMELIPSDSLLTSENARIDYSFVTGESTPVEKGKGDLIFAGGRQIGEGVKLEVRKEVSESYLMQLWNNEIFSKETETRFGRMVNSISQYFTWIIICLSMIAFLLWYQSDFTTALNAFTSVLIVACPCALALSTPFTLGTAMRILGTRKFYLKQAGVLEDLTSFNHVVFDKTGTITHNNETELQFNGSELTERERREIKALVLNSTHPLSRSISSSISLDTHNEKIEAFEELPGKGLRARVNNRDLRLGSREFVIGKMAGNRPASVDGGTAVHIGFDGGYLGYYQLSNRYRDGLGPVLESLAKKYKLTVLTGDNEGERENLSKLFPPGTHFYFNQTPQGKLDHIKTLQNQGDKVLMIGDGLNDAGALKQSDTGITVAEDLVNFTPASDGIIHGPGVRDLHHYIRFAFTARNIIKVSFAISFMYNIVGVGFAMAGLLTPLVAAILMPLSSISVVAFATIVTNLSARLKGI